jgi:hypothetical protein
MATLDGYHKQKLAKQARVLKKITLMAVQHASKKFPTQMATVYLLSCRKYFGHVELS